MAVSSRTELRSWLKAIESLSAAVNTEQDLEALLDIVANTAKDLLGLSFSAVMLPDAGKQFLVVAGASGLPEKYVDTVNREHPIWLEADPFDGAPASRAFRTRAPSMVVDTDEEPDSAWVQLARSQGYRAILAVPLLTNGEVLGTLNSYLSTPHRFLSEEVEQLELIAVHATIAITSARILDGLRDRNRLILRSEEIHRRLLSVAVNSGGVSGIASSLNELLGCEVVIRDGQGTTLAAEPDPSVADRVIDEPPEFRLGPSGTPGMVQEVGAHVVADVVLDGRSVATIWLLDRAGRLDPLGVRAIEHASVVLSLELLRHRTAVEVEQSLRGELLAELLGGADPASAVIRDRAALMGHNLHLPHRMLVAEAILEDGAPRRGNVDSLHADAAPVAAGQASRLTSHMKPRPLIGVVGGLVVALWPTEGSGANGDEILRRSFAATKLGVSASVAVTEVDRQGIPGAFRTARGALALASLGRRPPDVVHLGDLGAAGLLLEFADTSELRRYSDRTLGALREYDADHGSQLLHTLRAYLDCGLIRHATSERLVVHPNTVSQRLRRIEALTGLDLSSPRSVVEAETALMLAAVADASDDVSSAP